MNAIANDHVGIIGSGRLGQAMARTTLRAGRSAVMANSHGPESLTSVVSTLGEGASAGTVNQAAAAPMVVIAVPWDRVPDAVRGRRSEEHTSELQSLAYLVCRLLLEKKKK